MIKAIPNFLSVGFFLCFFFFVYAVFGLYLFTDSTYYRCRELEKPFNATYWPKSQPDRWCDPSDTDFCGKENFCGSPSSFNIDLKDDGVYGDVMLNYGYASFDHLALAVFSVFQVMTLDGWT